MNSDADKQQRMSDGGSSDGALPARERQPLYSELGRFERVPDVLVLAGVKRAERHRERDGEGVMMSDIAEHLGFVHGSWTTRRLRPQLDALIAEGSLARSRRHRVVVWALTEAGRGQLERMRRAGEVGELPEAPQHRAWRHARATAGERIDGFRTEAREALEEAAMLLDAEDAHSDAWFGAAERLQASCWRVGSAAHCLREWREPDDARPDVDDRCEAGDDLLDSEELGGVRYRRTGRRGVWRWPKPDPLD
jgi:DNA-binding MarR family transcriptional regulator